MRVLVVDDDRTTTTVMSEMLSTQHDVDSTSDVWEAVDMMNASKYDVLITDLNMPGINGATLSNMVKTDFPSVYIVMVTGTEVDANNKAISDNVDDLMLKPVKWSKLLDLLNVVQERKTHGDASTI